MSALTKIRIFPTGMRLHEWIAFEEGYFGAEGLDPEVMWDVYLGQMKAWSGGYKLRPQDQPFPVMPSTTHIVPLMVGDPVKAKKISDILLAEYGVYVQPINYPTVPRGTERLRFTPGPSHDEAMMQELTKALVEIWDRLELRLAA